MLIDDLLSRGVGWRAAARRRGSSGAGRARDRTGRLYIAALGPDARGQERAAGAFGEEHPLQEVREHVPEDQTCSERMRSEMFVNIVYLYYTQYITSTGSIVIRSGGADQRRRPRRSTQRTTSPPASGTCCSRNARRTRTQSRAAHKAFMHRSLIILLRVTFVGFYSCALGAPLTITFYSNHPSN